ncbi:hypothetical protein [Burkholderia pseudomallei]|uniref:hypothetical protein n=1 Tax=Burkholderia pseudomallei TaxID=28450 RepID=UPI00126A4E94|nr:hypothetical protein [Burkholderia pseudomallei]
MKKSEATSPQTIETIARIRSAQQMKQSTCFPQNDVLVTDLKHEIDRMRDCLSWPFEHVGKAFEPYMDRVAEFARLPDPIDDAIQKRLALAEDYPAPDPYCLDLDYRTHLLHACLHVARAEGALNQQNPEEGWFFISEAKKCFGRSEGYYQVAAERNMKTSRATLGGQQKSRNEKDRERQLYVQLLQSLAPPSGWESESAATAKVSSVATGILETFGATIGDTYAKLADFLRDDPDVRAAFERKQFRRAR